MAAVLGLEASGGYGTYVMNDADQSLRSFDLALGGRFGTMDRGASFGVFGRAWPREALLMRFGIEKLGARVEDLGVSYDLSAWEFSLTGTWFLPSSGFARFGFGGGLGVYETAGKVEAPGVDMKASGIAPGIQGGIEVEAPLVSGWTACAVAGGRYAKIQTLKFGTRDTRHAAEYSGTFVRLSVAHDWR